MNCISDEIIQYYIDNELTPEDRAGTEKHLTDCPECRKRLEEQRQLASFLKEANTETFEMEIPAFVPPSPKRELPLWKRRLYLYPGVAACCALLIYIMVHSSHKQVLPEAEYSIFYNLEGEFDSNKPFSQQDLQLYAVDRNGNIVELY